MTQPLTGVQRYAGEIVRALDEEIDRGNPLADDLAVDLIVPRGTQPPFPLKAVRIIEKGSFKGHLWEQTVLPAHVRGGLLSLGNSGPLTVRRQIVCIHDMNTRVVPESYSLGFRAMQRVLLPLLGRTSASIATVSAYSAAQIARYGIRDRSTVVIMPNGHEHVGRWTTPEGNDAVAVARRNTIVMIGTPAPHKNIALVLGLAERLRGVGLDIAVVGARDAKVYQDGGLGSGGANVAWLGKLPDTDLATLLRTCLCLAFPSRTEGFGLPPLEAMALGCPVVVSDQASLPEICGDAALYAPPSEPDAWFDCFLRLKRDPALRETMIARGAERAGLFSWRRSAQLYLEAMSRLDAAQPVLDIAPQPARRHATAD